MAQAGVVLHLRTKHCYTLNKTAVAVWKSLDEAVPRPLSDVAARLDRRVCRKHSIEHLSARVMAARYVELYRAAMDRR